MRPAKLWTGVWVAFALNVLYDRLEALDGGRDRLLRWVRHSLYKGICRRHGGDDGGDLQKWGHLGTSYTVIILLQGRRCAIPASHERYQSNRTFVDEQFSPGRVISVGLAIDLA